MICAISGCKNTELDERGPVWVHVTEFHRRPVKVCVPHWEAIMSVLGEQT